MNFNLLENNLNFTNLIVKFKKENHLLRLSIVNLAVVKIVL
jgi:hypothetical protein